MRQGAFTLPIREATGFLLTGTEVNILKTINDDFPKLRRKVRRQDSFAYKSIYQILLLG